MKRVIFLMGYVNGGKSTLYREHLLHYPMIDILDEQDAMRAVLGRELSYVDVFRSYVLLKRNMIRKLKESDLVVEHTLLKATRRAYYLRNVPNGVEKVGIWVQPLDYNYIRAFVETHDTTLQIAEAYYERNKEVAEPPSLDEGFDSLTRISSTLQLDHQNGKENQAQLLEYLQ